MRSTSPSEIEEGEERAAGFVLFRNFKDRRRYLLLQHRNGHHWGFPKGRLDTGEDEMTAALRETMEETGISDVIRIPGFRETSTYTLVRNGQPIRKTVACFLAETSQSCVSLSHEHEHYQWLAFPDAVSCLTHDESRRILIAAEQRLLNPTAVSE